MNQFAEWLSQTNLAMGISVAAVFQVSLRRHEEHWEDAVRDRASIKWHAILTFLVWVDIIILGRLIAYDHVWGSWSPAQKA